MSIDLREGDILVVGSKRYRVQFSNVQSMPVTPSFKRMATIAASTRRNPAGGTETTPIASAFVVEPQKASTDVMTTTASKAPYKLKSTFGYVAGNLTEYFEMTIEDMA